MLHHLLQHLTSATTSPNGVALTAITISCRQDPCEENSYASIYGATSTTTAFTQQQRARTQKSSASLRKWTSSGVSQASTGRAITRYYSYPYNHLNIADKRLTLHRRGIWALIQATISQIDFDYAAYA